MWPFDQAGPAGQSGAILALYLVTLALHAVFVGYVVGGTGYVLWSALRRREDPVADTVRDRLPFMLGCGITAGVAPLLFVQLLYQHRFYTANLLLGPRWLAVVPALIVGFYALYLAKTSAHWRRIALGAALGCFGFVAWSWSELHELMAADAHWQAFYAAGERVFLAGTIAPRLAVWLGAMVTTFATVAAWSAPVDGRARLARLAIGARLASIAGAVWTARVGFEVVGPARAWLGVLGAAVVVELGAWAWVALRRTERGLAMATAAGSAAMLAAVVVREAPRLALIEPVHTLAGTAGGWPVFGVVGVAGVAAIGWIVQTARR